jgi:hypothetical protein
MGHGAWSMGHGVQPVAGRGQKTEVRGQRVISNCGLRIANLKNKRQRFSCGSGFQPRFCDLNGLNDFYEFNGFNGFSNFLIL